MGSASIKYKIMPSSPEADIRKIESETKSLLEKEGVKAVNFEEQPVAFGLRALIVLFVWPEERPLEDIQEKMERIENVNSVQLLDIRRAVG